MLESTAGGDSCAKAFVNRLLPLACERVADGAGLGVLQERHDHPRIKPAGQRNSKTARAANVARQHRSEGCLERRLELRRTKLGQLLPFDRCEVPLLPLHTALDGPRVAGPQHFYTPEQRSRVRDEAQCKPLGDAPIFQRSQVRQHLQQCLGLAREIERIAVPMRIEALKAVTIAEEQRPPLLVVDHHGAAEAVQAGDEAVASGPVECRQVRLAGIRHALARRRDAQAVVARGALTRCIGVGVRDPSGIDSRPRGPALSPTDTLYRAACSTASPAQCDDTRFRAGG